MLTDFRDPYPPIKYENDINFTGKRDLGFFQDQNLHCSSPHNRLYMKATLSSMRHKASHADKLAPKDDLDFRLSSVYNHHTEFSAPEQDMLIQKETCGMTKRMLKNRTKKIVLPKPPLNHPIRVIIDDRAVSMFSINNAIGSNHTLATNGGYSRKPDGGHFTG